MDDDPEEIDPTFDFRADTPPGEDPDRCSQTLRRYHRLLWSKALPNGKRFELTESRTDCTLRHSSDLGDFVLSSDSVINSYRSWLRPGCLAELIARIDESELDRFQRSGYTIGGMMVFPCTPVDRRWTINQARGMFTTAIADRMDLTLECIRRYYLGEASPLDGVLRRYRTFFDLFDDFRGYVDFFLLQDLVKPDYSEVAYFLPCENFKRSALPDSLDEYTRYMAASMEFVNARNDRIVGSRGQQQPGPENAL